MAAIMGKDGSFRVGANVVGNIDSWTINRSVGTAEITSFGSTWEDHDPTIRAWTASIAGTLDSTDAQQLSLRDQLEDATLANITCNFRLAGTTAPVYSGSGIIESDAVGPSGVKDKVSYSATIRGDGAMTWDPS